MKIRTVWICLIAGIVAASGAANAQQGAREVGVIELQREEVPRILTLPGRALAYEQAAIIPRVSGIVEEVLYSPGRAVEAGTPLFRIDVGTYQASVSQAEADVAAAEAALAQSEAAYSRAERLVGSGVTQADFEAAAANREQARATLQIARAQLDIAETELSWTTVTSPIAGMASVPAITVGSFVSANQSDPMTTITRLDPIDVRMYEPSGHAQSIRTDIEEGRININESLRATLTLENGQTYSATGELIAPSFDVSATTGTIEVRFRFDNPEYRIYPGMFVRGQIDLGTTPAILLPQLAATRGRDGQLRAWVVEDGKAVERRLVEDSAYNNSWVILDGLEEGDTLVVDGFSGLVAGAEVTPVAVEFDENGVIRDIGSQTQEAN